MLSLVGAAVVAGLAPIAAYGDEPARQIRIQLTQSGEPRPRVLSISDEEVLKAKVKVAQLSKYWISVGCEAAGDALKAQLGIVQGLVVESVGDNAPAAKAGIRQHDVLLQFGEQKLAAVEDLIAAVDKSEGKQAVVVLLRGGKQTKVEITPVERPTVRYVAPTEDRLRLWQKLAPQMGFDFKLPDGAAGEAGPLRMLNIHPGIVLQGGGHIKLPEGLTVIVTKQGDKPAEITVKRGDKSWNVTEDKLDDLPEDVRDDVKRYLGRKGTWLPWQFEAPVARPQLEDPKGQAEGVDPQPTPTLRFRALGLEERSMRQQLEALIKQLEEMRGRLPDDDGLEAMRREIKELRREVDELRKERSGEK
jgi:membrane-associated protease RseP (regulator of RpoE activity)